MGNGGNEVNDSLIADIVANMNLNDKGGNNLQTQDSITTLNWSNILDKNKKSRENKIIDERVYQAL